MIKSLLCATSVFSMFQWSLFATTRQTTKDAENTEVAQRKLTKKTTNEELFPVLQFQLYKHRFSRFNHRTIKQ